MGKRSRPSVIVPYHVYHFKDMRSEFDFVCLKPMIPLSKALSSDLLTNIMYINYHGDLAIGEMWKSGFQPQCGNITDCKIDIRFVRYINNKTERIQYFIKLARLMTA